MIDIYVTNHADKRLKQRAGVTKKNRKEVAIDAYEKGLKHSDCTGRLHKYVTLLYFQHQTANQIRVYHEKVFIFNGKTLITLLPLPNNLRELAKIIEGKVSEMS